MSILVHLSTCAYAQATPLLGVEGIIFRDYNNNGVPDANEPGISDVPVIGFWKDCNTQATGMVTKTTDKNGHYALSDIPNGAHVRVEFQPTNAYLKYSQHGSNNGTVVQFVTTPTLSANLGLLNPNEYSESTVPIAAITYINGDPLAGGSAGEGNALNIFDYKSPKIIQKTLSAKAIGATWGLAYHRESKSLFTSALLKRHVGMGSLGAGGIYRINTTTMAAAPFVDLASLGVEVGSIKRSLPADATQNSLDIEAYDAVGRQALGGMAISEDGNSLWVVSLFKKELVEIDISGAKPLLKNKYQIPNPKCSDNDYQPWALKIKDNKIYIGVVCSAETSQLQKNLYANILMLDNGTFNTVVNFPLNYLRGNAGGTQGKISAAWQPWSSAYRSLDDPEKFTIFPQPILSDIAFDEDKSMILAFMDRTTHQIGGSNYAPIAQNPMFLTQGQTAGDILRVAFDGNNYILENNGKAGLRSSEGKNNGQGPNGGEYYWSDAYIYNSINPSSGFLQETSLGALIVKSGSNETLVATQNPDANANTVGVNWFNNITGDRIKNRTAHYTITPVNEASTGKSIGMGALAMLTENAPIEIGNRVWVDSNKNGVQDPCEFPLSNLNVSLYDEDGNIVGKTGTDANGEYYFNQTNVFDREGNSGLKYHTKYYLFFGTNQQFSKNKFVLHNTKYALTTRNATVPPFSNDKNTSDGDIFTISSTARTSFAQLDGFPFIEVTTGGAGESNHNIDMGLVLADCPTLMGTPLNLTICSGDELPALCATTSANNVIYRAFTSTQTDPYTATGGIELTTIIPQNGQVCADKIILPENKTDTPITYFIYAIVSPTSDDDTCRPSVVYKITVMPKNVPIGDFVWDDKNKNGLQDATESGIKGIVLKLYDANNIELASTTTDDNGYYAFNVIHGKYRIKAILPNNYKTTQLSTNNDELDSDFAKDGSTPLFEVLCGFQNLDLDLGLQESLDNTNITDIKGFVWDDANANGIYEATEKPISNAYVLLYNQVTDVSSYTTTDATGAYIFKNILLSTYRMRFIVNDIKYMPTKQNIGDDAKDSDQDANGYTDSFELTQATPYTFDAGFAPNTTSGCIIVAEGNTLCAPAPMNGFFDIFLKVIATNASEKWVVMVEQKNELVTYEGDYFDNDNIFQEKYYAGWFAISGGPVIITIMDKDNPNCSTTIIVQPPANCLSAALEDTKNAEISGLVWNDIDKNGIKNSGESTLDGFYVLLYDQNGQELAYTITTADGKYKFTALPKGTYQIKFATPKGFVPTQKDVGNDDNIDNDADWLGFTDKINLSIGEIKNNISAGFVKLDECLLSCEARVMQSLDTSGRNGALTVDIMREGEKPYKFEWSNSATTQTITGLNPGTFMVTVTDAKNCTCVSVISLVGSTGQLQGIPQRLQSNATVMAINNNNIPAYPNPTGAVLFLDMSNIKPKTTLRWALIDAQGRLIKEKIIPEIDNTIYSIDVSELPKGIYVLTLDADDKKTIQKIVKN